MHKLKLLILAIATFLFVGCDALTVTTQYDRGYDNYDFYYDNYNYNSIHLLYMNNPRWFYDNYYIDMYGRPIYYHRHPYYLRYQREHQRRIKRGRDVNLPTVGQTRINSTRNIKRSNNSTHTRRAVINNNRTTSTNRSATSKTRATTTPNTRTRANTSARTTARTKRPSLTKNAPTRSRARTIAPTRTNSTPTRSTQRTKTKRN